MLLFLNSFIKIYLLQNLEILSRFSLAGKLLNKIGRQLLLTNCNKTSSEDIQPTLQKIALAMLDENCI